MNDFLNKAKDMAGEHSDQVKQGIDKGEAFANEKTGDKYSEQVEKGGDAVEKGLGLDGDKK